MRKIKFRVWNRDKQRMLGIQELDNYNISPVDGHILFLDGHDCSHTLVPLQYTGIVDRNGKEIYEGDTVSCLNCNINLETGDNPAFLAVVCWRFTKLAWCLYDNVNGQIKMLCEFRDDEMKVVGNIYENPELLEKW